MFFDILHLRCATFGLSRVVDNPHLLDGADCARDRLLVRFAHIPSQVILTSLYMRIAPTYCTTHHMHAKTGFFPPNEVAPRVCSRVDVLPVLGGSPTCARTQVPCSTPSQGVPSP